MLLNDKLYNFLKAVAMIWLPAAGTLYFSLADIWDLPAADKVVGTIVAVDTFLGVILGISTKTYNNRELNYDGNLAVVQKDDEDAELHLTSVDVVALREKPAVLFKINRE